MADSAQDPKVEDVLSSVRRLVSQEIPKRSVPKSGSEDGALVLTSKDRIKADHTARVAARSLEQRIAELEAAVDSRAQEFEPDGSEDQAQHRPDRIVYTRPRSTETEAQQPRSTLRLSEISVSTPGPDAEPDASGETDAPVEFRRGTTKPLSEAPMAEDVPTLPAASADVHAFSDPDDVVARIEARIERGGEMAEMPAREIAPPEDEFDAELKAAVRASLVPQPTEEEPEGPDEADTLVLGETFADAAPEVKAFTPDSFEAEEPETAEADAVSEPAVAVEIEAPVDEPAPEFVLAGKPAAERTEPAVEAPKVAGPTVPEAMSARAAHEIEQSVEPDEAVTPTEAAEAALGALPDEEAMRLLVARLLREELRGDLGKQITRNVRKLVRSEILRVMETRKLD